VWEDRREERGKQRRDPATNRREGEDNVRKTGKKIKKK
jgi:hypothetical protein